MEGLTVTLIVVVVVVIFARVLAGTAPSGQSFTLSPFTLPSGVGLGTVALAAVFGLLSFAGFEGAASLGEETDNPRRDIPRHRDGRDNHGRLLHDRYAGPDSGLRDR